MSEFAQLPSQTFPVSTFLVLNTAKCKRRLSNYHPTVWGHEVIESLTTPYTYDLYSAKLDILKEETRKLIKSSPEPSTIIDSIQRLGLAYHFEEEIDAALNILFSNISSSNLSMTALQFRLLREHGHGVSTDVFDKFKDKDGKWLESIEKDVTGLLSLYEASFYGNDGEHDLEEVGRFVVKQFESLNGMTEMNQAEDTEKQLQLPRHWRMQRLGARNFIEHLNNLAGNGTPSVLLELAKLDYNLVQSQYQKEVKELTEWWKNLGLKEALGFARDRLMENYLWALGNMFEPQYSRCRIGITKFVCIFSTIDDMYDIYGSLDELERFTEAVKRWDISAIDDLPEYMKICYLAMLNFGNEVVYGVLRDHGLNVASYIKEAWGNLCSAYLVEARWFYSNYTPTLNEYLDNAWISVGGPAAITHTYLLLGSGVTINDLNDLTTYSGPVYWASMITRLTDDLATSKAEIMRGDVAKSIQCYMMNEGVSEEEARDQMKVLISMSWRKLNKVLHGNQSLVPKSIAKISVNMARTAMCVFQHGDGICSSTGVTKDRLTSLIAEPLLI